MPYIINKTNGEPLLTLEDGTLNDDYSVGLLGKNTIGYGEVQNENFIHLLENFAGIAPPSGNILTGQVYYNTENKQINVYDGSQWKIVGDTIVHPRDPMLSIADQGLGITAPSRGALWLNSTTQQLFVYNSGWKLIGPEAVENFGTTRAVTTVLIDTVGTRHPVIQLIINNSVIAICSSTLFTIANSNAVNGFSVIKPGITMSTTVDIKGNVDGNSLTATRLQNSRLINGQPFDGSSDITITASASTTLIRGEYLLGDNFNGSAPTTWSVDATAVSNPLKIVVRNELGDFSARNITANLIGNVTGNVTVLTGTSQFNNVVANSFEGNITGNLIGLASSTLKLENSRSINGVSFNGTANINITAPTPTPLVPGQYVQGDSFDGSISRSWNVLATPNNDAEKIVARDSQGNFVAGTITANIVGNITGNVTSAGVSNFNIINASQLTGTLTGNASGNAGSATRLQTPRAINGVLIDGTAPSTVKSSTTNILTKGSYLTGENFDGATPTTWAVDATSANTLNKIVARDGSGNFSASTITASLVGNVTGNLTGNVIGNLTGNTTGTHNGSVVGNVTGNVTGSASNNVLKAGDTMTGDINWTATSQGINWALNSDGASIRFYNTGDGDTNSRLEFETRDNNNEYFRWSHTPSGGTNYESMRLVTNGSDNAALTVRGSISAVGSVSASSLSGNGSSITNLNASQLTTGTVDSSRLSGTYSINIAGSASNNVSITGDTMTGYLTLIGSPVNANHAATKSYVDTFAALTITYGNTQYSTSGFTNQVGSFNNNRNYFDVFPPAGKTMGNLEAFIPSIAVIHYAGGVDGNDSLRCVWSSTEVPGRIRVWVQNTEQRSTPAANWLAIWR
jgi:hypothetical protein